MKLIIIAFLLFLGFLNNANALTSEQRALLISSNVPSWVLRAGGIPANIDLNFATGQIYGCATLVSCLSITRASNKTDLLPSSASGFAYNIFSNNVLAITPTLGLLIEEARTNQLLNSTSPATQTTGSLANGTYTLWVNGSGTATMSTGTATGCGTGVASQGTPVNFTTSGAAGTCTVTVAGSLNAFQLELGAFGTSLIVTAGATATRAADSIPTTGTAATVLTATSVSVALQVTRMLDTGTERVFVGNGSGSARLERNFTNTPVIFNAAASALIQASTPTWTSLNKIGASWDANGRSLVANGAGLVTDAATNTLSGTPMIGQQSGGTKILNGYLSRFPVWSPKISDSALSGVTQ